MAVKRRLRVTHQRLMDISLNIQTRRFTACRSNTDMSMSVNVHTGFEVGEQLSVIPLHQGMTSNLHDTLVGIRGDTVEVTWQVAGRGRVF